MKRFFQPIVKDGSSKKPALSTTADTPLCPAADGGGDKKEEKRGATAPLKFLTWNANSLLLRAKNNWPEFSRLVQSLDPDVICFQVVPPSAYSSFLALSDAFEMVHFEDILSYIAPAFLFRGWIVRFVFYFSRAIANELGLLFYVDDLN